jgi:hypothetical protein
MITIDIELVYLDIIQNLNRVIPPEKDIDLFEDIHDSLVQSRVIIWSALHDESRYLLLNLPN